jgi:hypothetical protein
MRPESPSPSPAPLVGEMIPSHGGGRLRRGNPGNRGRQASAVRAACLKDFESLRPEILARFGLGSGRSDGMDVAEVRAKLAASLDAIRKVCPAPLAQTLVDELRSAWTGKGR